MENSQVAAASSGGFSLSSVLGIVFIVLKLCGVINWSWLWVLAPFWMPLFFIFGFLAVFVVLGLIVNR